MPSWKKIILSGSNAILSSINNDSTVSATNITGSFTGSFSGDGSQITNLPSGTTPTLDTVTTQGNVTTNAITAGTISGSAFKLNNANALSHTGNVLYVGNANDWTTVELGRQATDEIHVNGLLKAEQLLRAEQSAEITGSLNVSGSGGLKVEGPFELSMTASSGGATPFSIKAASDLATDKIIEIKDDGGSYNLLQLDSEGALKIREAGNSGEGGGVYIQSGGTTADHANMYVNGGTARLSISSNTNGKFDVVPGGQSNGYLVGLTGKGTMALGQGATAGTKPSENNTNTLYIINGTNPTNTPTDGFALFSKDVNSGAGTASPTFLTEDDTTIQLGTTSSLVHVEATTFKGDGSGLTGLGTVDTTGTPANNQIATFTDANTLEGTSSFTYDSSTKELLIGASSAGNTETNTLKIQGYNSSNPAMLKLGWNTYGGAALESGFNGTLSLYNFGTSATAGGRLIVGEAGDTGTNQTNYLWIRGDNADDSTHIYMGANSITYSSEIGIERQEGTGVNYESDIALRAAAGLNGHKSEYIFSRKGMFQAQDAGFTVSGSGQVFINVVTSSISPIQQLSGFDQALVVNGTITASAFQGDGSQLTGVGTLTGNGTSTRVPFYNGTTSLTTNSGFVYTNGSKRLELTGDGSNAPLRISNLQSPDSSQVALVVDSENNNDIQKRTLGNNAFNSTTIPTNTSQLTNGAGFLTSLSGAILTSGNQTATGVKTFSGAISSSAGIYLPTGANVGSFASDWNMIGDRPKIKVAQNLAIYNQNNAQIAIFGSNFSSVISGSLTVGGGSALGPTSPILDGRIDAKNDVVAFSTSDKRLKDNITPIDSALDKISKIQGIEFDWIPAPGVHGNEGHDVGVIAQEIEEVLPEVVNTRDNGYKAVKYEKIVPLLIESIKELKSEIEELKRGK